MKLQRREVLLQAMTGASVIFIAAPSWAETWPAKTIRLVVPFPPGGLIDNMARLLGTQLTQELGQTIVVEKTNLPSAISQVQAGKLTALAVTTPQRSPALPNVPTMVEAGLPIAVEQKISAALEKALKQPEVTTAMQTQGATPAFLGSAEMARFMAKDAKQWKQVADFAKIRLG